MPPGVTLLNHQLTSARISRTLIRIPRNPRMKPMYAMKSGSRPLSMIDSWNQWPIR